MLCNMLQEQINIGIKKMKERKTPDYIIEAFVEDTIHSEEIACEECELYDSCFNEGVW